MTDFRYQPTCAIVGVNQGIALTNEGSVVHNFSLEGPDVDLDVAAGEEGRFEAIGGIAQPGVHTLFCKYHRDAGMFGELRIRD
jgi:plastocyanin